MKRGRTLATWTLSLIAAACALPQASCATRSEDCALNLTCPPEGAGGGDGDVGPACEAGPTEDASTVTDECAVFASANAAPGGDGTKEKPYASLAEAIVHAHGKRVLACASGAFAESVTIDAAVEVIGGFDCDTGWTWSEEGRSAIEGPADRIALTLGEGASGAKVRSFAVRAASATKAGGSSIGVAVADIEAELSQVDVTAGDAMDGAKGETPAEASQAGASATMMSATNACELPAAVRGGEPGTTTCEDGETTGGRGGRGGSPGIEDGNGLRGEDGAPLPKENPDEYGLGGIGETDTKECRDGEEGKRGDPGTAGAAGIATTLTLTGIAGGDGGTGTSGKRGQGGGGGGGTKAGPFCTVGEEVVGGVGASGSGGGAGGCGGKGGGGGKAGGSSVGIVSLGTNLLLTDVTVAVGKAGKGGEGVLGQSGAAGGRRSAGGASSGLGSSHYGCWGGDGGDGGWGGPGGGGRGGHAVGIAYAAAPSEAPAVQFRPGTAGDGGAAALGSPAAGGPPESAGAPGSAGLCWNFGSGRSCEN
ncbi:hypothetical protein ACSRUE_18045 [Sorangium sp. KYC3313]|uniref:hypothetical protein n=1 Tax=Sorangium sp. KYC3313 TaxID=3449740 RepID=UPI003F8CDCD1